MKKTNSRSTNENVSMMEEKNNETFSLSVCLNRVLVKVKEKKFSKSIIDELKDDFNYIESKFGICPQESVILACVLENGGCYGSCDDADIAETMGCTNIEFIKYRKYLDSLSDKRIVRKVKSRYSSVSSYTIPKEACQAIIDDTEYSEESLSELSPEEMFLQMRLLFKAHKDDEINEEILLNDLNLLVESNQQNVFSQKVTQYNIKKLTKSEQRIFYYLCIRYVNFGDKYVDFKLISDLLTEREDSQMFFRHFQSGRTRMQVKDLVTFGGDDSFIDKSLIALSDKVKEEFFIEFDLLFEDNSNGNRDLMSCDSIVTKELFYNESEQEQINRLERLLDEEYFKGVQERLEEMGMRKGFNIILYGGPGTGKTETTMQLAKKTGRDIYYIDMSKLRSKWVGESEKSVKAVFTTYRILCKNKKLKPILFFNEADAIFGKRVERIESSTAQMLNTLQNIILEEMETIDGIMICTTNLQCNLDPAFERRFIYKIELDKPGEKVRAKIWKSMLKGLDDEDYTTLAERYSFSGGQIENVVRKSAVEYILSGNKITLEMVCNFCNEENFSSKSNRNKMGF